MRAPRWTISAKYRRCCASVPSAASSSITVECMLNVSAVAEQARAISRSACT